MRTAPSLERDATPKPLTRGLAAVFFHPEANLATYKCYFLRGDHAPMLKTIDCDEDAKAIRQAKMLVNSNPKHSGIEIWKDAHLVARVFRSGSS